MVAERLGYTVSELEERLSFTEWQFWLGLLSVTEPAEREEAKAQQ